MRPTVRWTLAGAVIIAVFQFSLAGLLVSGVGKSYVPDPARVAVSQARFTGGGSTSIRNVDLDHLEWKEAGYFQRNRDLGQVFTPEDDFQLQAIVLRTGPSDNAVLAGAPGANVFIQFFEVVGTPRIEDAGTPAGTPAKHGFSSNHRCDDFIVGITYRPLRLVKGGVFPDIPPTRDAEGKVMDGDSGRLYYLRWELTGSDRLHLEAGKRYAFIIGFEQPGPARGFTLANWNAAGVDAEPSFGDAHDFYPGGWGIRREGDGTVPPAMTRGPIPPSVEVERATLLGQSLFAEDDARFSLSPTTDGYPDVDTYRDLEFYLEATIGEP